MVEERKASLRGQHIVIVGNGIAGNSAASAIRHVDKDVAVTIISEQKWPLYSPCAFHKCLSGEMEKQKLFLKKAEDYTKEGVKVIFGQEASEVDVKNRRVFVGGKSISFDKLVLAVGSRVIIPPIKGIDKRGVFLFKTINDLRAILTWPANKVCVIGSGPIGVEVAIAFRKRGLEVSIIECLDRLLPRLFEDKAASMLREIIEGRGINVFTGERVTEIFGNKVVEGLATNRRQIECDTIVIAAGVSPNTELAKKMRLQVGNLGGTEADDYMMTSVEDIYVCGDCAESKDIFTSERTLSLLWHNAKRQGWIAGSNSAGRRSRFAGSLNATTVEIFGNLSLSVGRSASSLSSRSQFEMIEKVSDSQYCLLIIANDRLVGMQLINRSKHVGLLVSKMLRRDNLLELAKLVQDDRLLSMKPWHYWVKDYLTRERS